MLNKTHNYITCVLLLHMWTCTAKYSNVALKKPAYQTDTYANGSPASAAVDGNTYQTWTYDGTCTHTVTDDVIWEVDLSGLYDIDQVIIYNRQDSVSERLQEVELYVGILRDRYRLKAYQPGLAGSILTLPLDGVVIARWVKITRRIPNGPLTLCEVLVMGRAVYSNLIKRGQHGALGSAERSVATYSQHHCAYVCVVDRVCNGAQYNKETGTCHMFTDSSPSLSNDTNKVFLELL